MPGMMSTVDLVRAVRERIGAEITARIEKLITNPDADRAGHIRGLRQALDFLNEEYEKASK